MGRPDLGGQASTLIGRQELTLTSLVFTAIFFERGSPCRPKQTMSKRWTPNHSLQWESRPVDLFTNRAPLATAFSRHPFENFLFRTLPQWSIPPAPTGRNTPRNGSLLVGPSGPKSEPTHSSSDRVHRFRIFRQEFTGHYVVKLVQR